MPLWLRAVVVLAVYSLATVLGDSLSVWGAIPTFWPPAGVAVAFLALSAYEDWPVILLAVAAAGVSTDLLIGRTSIVAVGFTAAHCIEAAVGAGLLRRFVGTPARLASRAAALRFGLYAVCAAPIVGATVGATVATIGVPGSDWVRDWAIWWSADSVGILIVGALAFAAIDLVERSRHEALRPNAQRIAGYVALLLITCVVGAVGTFDLGPLSGWKFVVFVPMGLIAALGGAIGATSAAFFLSVTMSAALGIALRQSVLPSDALSAEVLVMQGFLGVLTFTVLFVAAAIGEARAAAAAEHVVAEKYRVLLETLPTGVTISDESGVIVESDAQSEAILGVTGAQQRERRIDGSEWRILRPDGSEKPSAEWVSVAALRDSATLRGQEGLVRPDGRVVWLDVTAAPIPVAGYGVAITYNDITDQVEVRERLRASEVRLKDAAGHLEELVRTRTADLERANEDLREASAARSRFLANVSHELRTPLNSVIGFSGVMEQGLAGPLTEEQTREIRMIRSSGEHLLRLVDELLGMTRLEAGEREIRFESFALSSLVAELQQVTARLAAEKGLAFEVSCDCPELVMRTDRSGLGHALSNLLANAVKFTERGGVSLECRQDGEDVVFEVSDTGIGIPPEEVSRITEEFYQIERPEDGMKPAGTGLGLAISSHLVSLLGGSLTVASVVGQGTTFTARVPVHPAES